MANDKNWRVGLSFRNLRNIREEDLQENEFRVRSESGQMKPDSACNTYPYVCMCVCVSSSGIFEQTEGGHRITRDRNENIVPPSYISFVPWMRDTFVISLYIHDRVEARVSYSRIGNPVETNSGKSSLGSGRLVPLPLPRNSFCELFDTGTLFKNVRGISEARHFSGNYLLGRIEGEHFYHPSLSPIETELPPLVQDHPFFFRPLIRVSLECIFIVRSPSIFARMILNVRSIFN